MGQKINPIGFRVGVIRDWDAKWYAEKGEYVAALQEDIRLRKYIEANLKDAAVDRVTIERTELTRINVVIRTAKPGIILGRGGENVEKLRTELTKLADKTSDGKAKRVNINIIEIRKPDLNAHLVGMQIASDLERRIAFRRAMRGAIQRAQRAGAKGIRTMVSGRLNGADIARKEQYTEGTVPLHTLRADIDYSWDEAMTAYGNLGIKTWIYRGDVKPGELVTEEEVKPGERRSGGNNNRRSNGPRNNNRNNNGGQSRGPRAPRSEAQATPVAPAQAAAPEVAEGGNN
jgi:small subunit ribosomal protein S3